MRGRDEPALNGSGTGRYKHNIRLPVLKYGYGGVAVSHRGTRSMATTGDYQWNIAVRACGIYVFGKDASNLPWRDDFGDCSQRMIQNHRAFRGGQLSLAVKDKVHWDATLRSPQS